MFPSDPVHEATMRLQAGTSSEEDRALLLEALRLGTATLLTGERAVTIGGSVTDSIIVTGNGNVVFDKQSLVALKALLRDAPDSKFSPLYINSLTTAIDVLHYLPNADPQFLKKSLHSALWTIRTVVAAYYLDKDDLQINANVMVAASIDSNILEDYPGLLFVDPDADFQEYQCVLVIKGWAHDAHCSPSIFALPVAKERVWSMVGAARTFLTGNIAIIGDIHREAEVDRLVEGQSPIVAEAIREYFKLRTSFRSFVCWRITFREAPIGVLNVQSNRPDAFKADDLHGNNVIGYINPFCSALGAIVQSMIASGSFGAIPKD